jgi:hypothetical protein
VPPRKRWSNFFKILSEKSFRLLTNKRQEKIFNENKILRKQTRKVVKSRKAHQKPYFFEAKFLKNN